MPKTPADIFKNILKLRTHCVSCEFVSSGVRGSDGDLVELCVNFVFGVVWSTSRVRVVNNDETLAA